jgi:CheY-like chemotaxis protein
MPLERLSRIIPHLRRYARAMSGSQEDGDALVQATLGAILEGSLEIEADSMPLRVGLYRAFHDVWAAVLDGGTFSAQMPYKVDERLQALSARSRAAFLLTAMEGFTVPEVAVITGLPEDEVEAQIAEVHREIDRQLATRVLVIEDEWVIALDLSNLVKDLGHDVVGVAPTRDRAVDLARSSRPGLVLADIQLADGSSGIDAVASILESFDVPVIFVTAFPERLLTGTRPEPAYLVTKPFSRDAVQALISQALFFHEPRGREGAPTASSAEARDGA